MLQKYCSSKLAAVVPAESTADRGGVHQLKLRRQPLQSRVRHRPDRMKGSRLVAVIVGPLAMILPALGSDTLQVWTGNAEVPQRTAPVLTLWLSEH
jgi:hypothetical protein